LCNLVIEKFREAINHLVTQFSNHRLANQSIKQMPVSAARAAAFDILLRVAQQDAYAVELLHSPRLRDLSTADRGLCTELVMGTLRWQSRLDEALRPLSSQPLEKLDAEVLIALRLAAYQLGFLERIPARAALNESVELVKRARKRSAAPLVNAVLRKLSASAAEIRPPAPAIPAIPFTPETLSISYSHPQWMVARWAAQHGIENAQRICAHNQQVPPTTLRLPVDIRTGQQVEDELRSSGVELSSGALISSARRVIKGDVTHTPAFHAGRVRIQAEASQLIAALVGKTNSRRVLDCCAAPGGKTAAIAERNPMAHVVAVDLYPHRARLLRDLVRSQNVTVIAADALALPLAIDFDRVLTDVPCSGTGTLSRNPEIKWRLRPDDLRDLAARQLGILTAAMGHVGPGGRLVYSTCSLEQEENEDIVEHALETHPEFELLSMGEELQKLRAAGELVWQDVDSMVSGSYLRTLPGVHPCDGFFGAILSRL
jgi:16S rRNA (cytosine967-C5)-methyltransferase